MLYALDSAANFVGANAAGANTDSFVLTIGHHHFALLQVGVLEETVVLVGETNLVGLVTVLVANFADTGHGEKSFTIMH